MDGDQTKGFLWLTTKVDIDINHSYETDTGSGVIDLVQYDIGADEIGYCTRGFIVGGRFRARGWTGDVFKQSSPEEDIRFPDFGEEVTEYVECYASNYAQRMTGSGQIEQQTHDSSALTTWFDTLDVIQDSHQNQIRSCIYLESFH